MTNLSEAPGAEVLPRSAGANSLLNGHYAPPPRDEDGKTWVRTSALVQADAQKLYQLWRDVEAAPQWHERTLEVRKTGERTYHWVMRDEPSDNLLQWDFEIIADEPGKRIAWRSVKGEPENAGEVIFERAPGNRGTMVTVLQQFHLGKVSRAWEALRGRDPKQAVIEDLRRFKALAETGEFPRTEPQPHGERGAGARVKRAVYGENIQAPASTPQGESLVGQKGEDRP